MTVSLTFDDGPVATTERILDTLSTTSLKATFFIVGNQAQRRSKTLLRMTQEGHQIGNHSWSHPDLTKVSNATLEEEIKMTNDVIADSCGAFPSLFRPPYGLINSRIVSTIARYNLSSVLWNLDSNDWLLRDSHQITQRIFERIRANQVVLFHDTLSATKDAISMISSEFQRRDIFSVTVSDLRSYTVR